MSQVATNNAPPISDDLLEGADAIARELYGNAKYRRRVYQLKDELPIFQIGAKLFARKSTLLRWIEEREAKGAQ